MISDDNQKLALKLSLSLNKEASVLRAAAVMEANGDIDPRDKHVRRGLERASEIVRACADLGHLNNATALGVLKRAYFEGLIQMLWVTVTEKNAHTLRTALDEEIIRIGKINLRAGNLIIRDENSGEDVTRRILEDTRLANAFRKNIEACAAEAGVQQLYDLFYRFFSLETHGHSIHDGPNQRAWDITALHLQSIGALTKGFSEAGRRWLLYRERLDSEELRKVLGLTDAGPHRCVAEEARK